MFDPFFHVNRLENVYNDFLLKNLKNTYPIGFILIPICSGRNVVIEVAKGVGLWWFGFSHNLLDFILRFWGSNCHWQLQIINVSLKWKHHANKRDMCRMVFFFSCQDSPPAGNRKRRTLSKRNLSRRRGVPQFWLGGGGGVLRYYVRGR